MPRVLPRPIENAQVKPLVMFFNRWLHNTAVRIEALFGKVKYLPVQLSFLGPQGPKMEYFNEDDGLTLNQAGTALLKQAIFKLAGFVRNE